MSGAVLVSAARSIPSAPAIPTVAIPAPNQTIVDTTKAMSARRSTGNDPADPVWEDPEIGDGTVSDETETNSGIPTNVFLTELSPKAHELTYLLYWLHKTSVRGFEAAQRFGGDRMSINTLFDEPSPPKHLPLLVRDRRFPAQEILDNHLVKGQPVPSEAWMWLNLMHAVTSRGFVYRISDLRADTVKRSEMHKGFGGGRPVHPVSLTAKEREDGQRLVVGVPSPSGTIDFHHHSLKLNPSSPLEESDRLWKIQALQLVSLLKHDPPVAYENRDPTMTWPQQQRKQTRSLDDIEQASLTKLREGTQRVVAWNEKHERLQMVGAIRAKDHCLKCHEVQLGDLLGAFTYWIEEERKTPAETTVLQGESKPLR